jgi:menaquinol-cytochrome c reductase iron-sulfur subunit
VPDKHTQQKSKYTADRMIPGAFEGETVTRRRFMTVSSQAMGGIAAASFLLPALGLAIGPIFKQPPHSWQEIGDAQDFTNDNYIPVVVTIAEGIGEAGKTTAYVRRFNALIDTDPYDRNTPYIAISSRCAHLGCPVRWVDAAERFICPCHGGVYDLLGRRVGGPPVRPLDRFPTRVNGDKVELWSGRFSVNSELKRFSPRDPGEPLDGVGQYLYPSRPSARKL